MYIPDDGNWGLNVYDIALLHKKLFRFGAYCFNHRLGK